MRLESVIWVVTLIAGAWAALIYYQKGRNPLWVIGIALVLGAFGSAMGFLGWLVPFIAVILAMLSGSDQPTLLERQTRATRAIAQGQVARGELKKCPYCAELIQAEAIICRYCQREQPSATLPAAVQARIEVTPHNGRPSCSNCWEYVRANATTCPHCGASFVPITSVQATEEAQSSSPPQPPTTSMG